MLLAMAALTPYFISRLGTDGYGVWVLVMAVLGLGGVLDTGFGPAMARIVSHALARGDRAAVAGAVSTATAIDLALGSALAAAGWAAAPGAVDLLGLEGALRGDARTALRASLVVAVVATAVGTYEGVLVALQRMGTLAWLRIANALAFAAAAVIVLESGGGPDDLALALLAVWVVSGCAWFACARHAHGDALLRRAAIGREGLRQIVRFGLPRQASRVTLVAALHFERFLVGALVGVTAAARYGVASVLAGGLAMLLGQATVPLVPALTRVGALRGDAALDASYARAARALTLVTAGVFGATAAVAEPLMTAWAGPGFGESARYLQILCAGFVLWPLAQTGFTYAQALGAPRLEAKAALAGAATLVVVATGLVTLYGVSGVAVGTAIGLAVVPAAFFGLVLRSRPGVAAALRGMAGPIGLGAALAVVFAAANATLLDSADLARPAAAALATAQGLGFACLYLGLVRAAGGSALGEAIESLRGRGVAAGDQALKL